MNKVLRNRSSRSSKVVDFGTGRMRVHICNFALLISSNLGPTPVSFSVSELLQLSAEKDTHPYFKRNLWVFSLDLADLGASKSEDSWLTICVITSEVTRPS